MTPTVFLSSVIAPRAPMYPQHDSPEARCLMLAIAGQESGWTHRLQLPIAHARGFWQCERTGAVLAVLTSDSTKLPIYAVCDSLSIGRGLDDVFDAIAYNDTLAYWVARLALTLDPLALPRIGDADESYATYIRVWRPGKPDPDRWASQYGPCAELFEAPAA